MSVTLKDVAAKAGVSIGTVSNYLNNFSCVKTKNRERIEKAISDLGFTPNVNARVLASGKSKNVIMYILSEHAISPTTWLHQLPVIQVVHDYLDEVGYTLQICIVRAGDDKDFYNRIRCDVEGRSAIGVLILSVWQVPDLVINYLTEKSFPFVTLDNYCDNENVNSIFFDNYGSMFSLVDMLYQLGHRRIAFVNVHTQQQDMKMRFHGYLDGMHRHKLEVTEDLILYGDFSIESGYSCTMHALAANTHISAFLCGNDNMAVGAIKALTQKGFAVPAEISVVGVDNSIAAEACPLRLQTVQFDLGKLGEASVKTLLNLINEKQRGEPVKLKLPFHIISGETIGTYRGKQ